MSDDQVLDVSVKGAEDLVALARRMKAAGQGQLRRELLKTMRAQADPIVSDIKGAITSMPVTGTRGGGSKARRAHRGGKGKAHGLRRTIASAVQVKITTSGITTGVRIRVNKAKLPADQKTLPKALNKPGGFRHPVFGNRDAWAHQQGREFWEPSITPHIGAVRAAMAETVDRFAQELDSGS